MDLVTLLFAAASAVFAVYKLTRLKIVTVLPALYIFLCYQLFQNLLALGLTPLSANTTQYQTIYLLTEPITWILEILVVREIYKVLFRDYPGIASLAKWNVYIAAALAVMLCVLVAASGPSPRMGSILGYVTLWERFVMFGLALFIVFMVVLLSRFPIKLESNLATNIIVFTLFFFANSAVLAMSAAGTAFLINLRYFGSVSIYCVCFLAWGHYLKNPEESQIILTRKNIDAFERQRLLGQLAALNNLLVKAVRQ